jgi:hypothetical protein
MASALAKVDIVHINVDFPYPAQVDFTQVHHASDHEPVQLSFRPQGAAVVGGNLHYSGLRVTLLDEAQQPLADTFTDALGEFRFWHLTPGRVTLHITVPDYVALSLQDMTLSLKSGYNAIPTLPVQHGTTGLGSAVAWVGGQFAQAVTDKR